MRNGEDCPSKGRRLFFKQWAAGIGLLALTQFCQQQTARIWMTLSGTKHLLGHRLWLKDFPKPNQIMETPLLIVGAGISGLSAARQCHRRGQTDFIMVDLEDHWGGNARSGSTPLSAYPLGAHYLPVPNAHDAELLTFLSEIQLVSGPDEQGKWHLNERHLVFEPRERLYYKNRWQSGLQPQAGPECQAAFDRFMIQMDAFREWKIEEKYVFDLPMANAAPSTEKIALDQITMAQWMREHQHTLPELLHYVDYCCRDDFGLGMEFISAYAGIHYFAARKHNLTTDNPDSLFTWPEGNAFLAQQFEPYIRDKFWANHLVYRVNPGPDHAEVWVYNAQHNNSICIRAQKVIMATPQFVNAHLIAERAHTARLCTYAPWLLATLTVRELTDKNEYPLCWDNVIHDAEGLGYIYNQHQNLTLDSNKKVITYYHSFSSAHPHQDRKMLLQKPVSYWTQHVLNDLKIAHPNIEDCTESIEIYRIGHGMISPVVGFITHSERNFAAAPIAQQIFFAHTDLSGISVFEEAFHLGLAAANAALDA